jgi:hypothetical protein
VPIGLQSPAEGLREACGGVKGQAGAVYPLGVWMGPQYPRNLDQGAVMDDHDEIGRPNYTRAGIERAIARQQRGRWRFRLPWDQDGGAFRIRAAVALLISAYA